VGNSLDVCARNDWAHASAQLGGLLDAEYDTQRLLVWYETRLSIDDAPVRIDAQAIRCERVTQEALRRACGPVQHDHVAQAHVGVWVW
jgi:hypothetical protein